MPFTVRTDRPLLPTEPSERLLRVELTVPRAEGGAARKPVHLSLVIDRSGSMAGDKLQLALHAARQAIRALQDGDRFSVVTFDEHIEVPVPSTEATAAARLRAEAALDAVTSRGNTNLGGGWLSGCAQVGKHLPEDALGRCLLLTDGQANHGITEPDELTRRARKLRMKRVTTSTLGLGEGFNEFLLGRLSEEGGGNFYFAERADQLPGFVARELGEVLSVVARDASLLVEAPEGVEVESLNDYPCTREGTTFSFSLGSLPGGLAMAPMLRLRFPAGPVGQQLSATVRLTDRDGALSNEPRTLAWTRGAQEQVRAQAVDVEVTRPAAALDAARARRVALELNRNGQWAEAASRLAEESTRLRDYAAGDRETLAHAGELDSEKEPYSTPMTSLAMKGRYYRSLLAMKRGTPDAPGARVLALPTAAPLAPPLRTATRALEGVEGAPTLEVNLSLQGSSLPPGVLSKNDELKLVAAAFALDEPSVKVVFVEPLLRDGWFSHWHAGERTAVISMAGWDQLSSLPEAAFMAYELVLYGLHALCAGYDAMKMVHQETRGCLFDFCQKKADVAIKLQAGHICDACLEELSDLGIDRDEVTELWRAVQTLAQSTSPPSS